MTRLSNGGSVTRIADTWHGTYIATRTVIAAYLAIGVALTLQPDRFANTPSYANLIILTSSQAWGAIYLLVTALLIAWRMVQPIWLGVVAHTLAIMLTLFWLVAFIIRYGTDNGTTIVNVVSWSVFLTLVIGSGTAMLRTIPPKPRADLSAS